MSPTTWAVKTMARSGAGPTGSGGGATVVAGAPTEPPAPAGGKGGTFCCAPASQIPPTARVVVATRAFTSMPGRGFKPSPWSGPADQDSAGRSDYRFGSAHGQITIPTRPAGGAGPALRGPGAIR